MNRSRQLTDPRSATAAATSGRKGLTYWPLASAISAVLAGAPAAYAQQTAGSSGGLEEVVVTAQKKSERMQDVPIAIVALGTEKLEELQIKNLDDYVKYLPSVSFSRGDGQGSNGQPGASHVYMRGVVSTPNENHSGSQPSVGTYLDEQPVTTIDGTVDVHVYDIARVEVLEGPQGTLYGASSEAGTIRIITNKPDPTKFDAAYNLGVEYNQKGHGGVGYTVEGFVNEPLSETAAVRLVGWYKHDQGFINNVAGTNAAAGIFDGVRTFPTWAASAGGGIGAGSIDNAAYQKNGYNTANTYGGRAALKLNIGDNWTVTPTAMGQYVSTQGFFGYDPAVGDLQLVHFGPENSQDGWGQAALTVEGKFANFDLVYAGAFMKRTTHSMADYADYSYFYDSSSGSGVHWVGNAGLQIGADGVVTSGVPIMPQELVYSKGYFQKWSHEVRLSTPQDKPVKATVGLFIERQLHDIWEQYVMPGYGFTSPQGDHPNPAGLADYLSIPTVWNTVWLTAEQRVDRDQAAFAQVTWDINPQWAATAGFRYFKYDNSLQGFYGYSGHNQDFQGFGPGMNQCFAPAMVNGTPCTDLDKTVSGNGHVPRLNVTWKFAQDKLAYATYSKGFRPGGVNRNGSLPPYHPDYLVNYELGWKTQWLNRHLRWNGALFWEDWKDFQFSFLGPSSLTIISNAGNARIKGIESELEWAVGGGLVLSWNATYLESRLLEDYCGWTDPSGNPVHYCPAGTLNPKGDPVDGPQATAGMNLPISPKFKTNVVARYTYPMAADWTGSVQAAFIYQTQTAPDLRPATVAQVGGMMPAYGMVDLSAGFEKNNMNIQFVITNLTDKRAEYSRFVQSAAALQPYVIVAQPLTFAVQFGQKF